MKLLYTYFWKRRIISLLSLLLIGIYSVSLMPQQVQAQSRQSADMYVSLWLAPEGDRRSNIVEPGERFDLDIQVENAGNGDANNVVVYIPYNRDVFLLTSNTNVTGVGDDEFRVSFDQVPAGNIRSTEITLRVGNNVRLGTQIALRADYVWDDNRRGREDTSDEVDIWVDYRDESADDDTNNDDTDDGTTVRIINEEPGSADTTPPTSCVLAITRQENASNYLVRWGGTDASGIRSYDVQIKQMPDGLWRDWKVKEEGTSAVFGPTEGKVFAFRVRARDNAGNEEAWPLSHQLTTQQADVTLQGCPGDSQGTDAV